MRLPILAALCASTLLVGCGQPTTVLPDGGRTRVNCTEDFDFVPVIVRNTAGEPVAEAVVTARHIGSGSTQEGVTNDQGLTTVVNEDLTSGSIQVTARAGTKQSPPGQIELVCGDCSCTATPDELTLTIAD